MPKFRLKMNSGWSNVKLRDQMIMEFYEFGDEIRNPMKPESSDSGLRSKRYPIFKIRKNSNLSWVKLKNKMTLNTKLTSKI